MLEGEEEAEDRKDMDTEPATQAHSPGVDPHIRRQMHDIRITNQSTRYWPSHLAHHDLCQGSTKWLSWLSKITENPISHGNFSMKITDKILKTGYF